MVIHLQTLDFTADKQLDAYVREKVSKLSHFFERIESAEVCLKLEPSATKDNKVCEIRLIVPGNDLFAKRNAESFELAAVETVEALEMQIRKMKTKFENAKKE
ncbi:MAG TPA: ribosome-associated translation inhibitor RaiA [Bacteroidia bacterium]|jgi:ribosomal subunit interface protein